MSESEVSEREGGRNQSYYVIGFFIYLFIYLFVYLCNAGVFVYMHISVCLLNTYCFMP